MRTHPFDEAEPSPEAVEWYSTAWRLVLRNILHWHDERIDTWIQSQAHRLYNPLLTHEHTSWYVAHLIVPPRLKEKLPQYNQFCFSDIVLALEGHGFRLADPDYDWPAARRRIEALLAQYGEKIPREE